MFFSRLSASALLSLVLTGCSAVPVTRNAGVQKRQAQFTLLAYPDFQISGGVGGNAKAEADAVFITPFAGVDLATISADTLTAIKTMRELAEDAETALFNPQIAAATGAEADALDVGKTKNKVLKLTAETFAIQIEIAQQKAAGEDTSANETDLAAEQKKLDNNIAKDTANAGAPSQAATGTVDVRDGRPSPAAAPAAEAPAVAEDVAVVTPPVANCSAVAPARRATFVFEDYSAFQISGGVAGNAEAEANAVFVTPFAGRDLTTVSSAELKALSDMRSLAENAETQLFNGQISAASGATAKALQVGKIKNKVLKLTGLAQIERIKIAQAKAAGKSSAADEAKLSEEQTKLTKNIATDKASAGATSQAASGTPTLRKRSFIAVFGSNFGRWN